MMKNEDGRASEVARNDTAFIITLRDITSYNLLFVRVLNYYDITLIIIIIDR